MVLARWGREGWGSPYTCSWQIQKKGPVLFPFPQVLDLSELAMLRGRVISV